jgi:hypothetical protein
LLFKSIVMTKAFKSYGCSASGANTGDVPDALEDHFGFGSGGTYEDYERIDRWVIKTDIDANRPVIFRGCEERTTFLGWAIYDECHAWLGDGYRITGDDCFKHFWYHMNWGWDGENDGFYYQTDWENPDGNFRYGQKFIHNIHL